MLIRFTFPVKSSLVLSECWPVSIGDIEIEWNTKDERVSGISASVKATDADQMPTVQPSDDPVVKSHINFGFASRQDEVEEAVRTIWGLLGLFAFVDIDFDSVETNWIPETPEERERLHLYNFSRTKQKADLSKPRRLAYDLVARAMLSGKAASHYEIPLGFLRRGTRAIHDSQYIEAFYSLFFYLETLFAPGYSKPKKVKDCLWDAEAVRTAVAGSRASFSREQRLNSAKRDRLLLMTDRQIIDHLVDLRGNLHHHALGKPGVWHPDKAENYQEEAILLQHIVHSIAIAKVIDFLYAKDRSEALMAAARAAGAIIKVRIEAIGLVDGVRRNLEPLFISVPCRQINRNALDGVHKLFREQFKGGPRNVEVLEYKLMSEDASQIYAAWQRAAPAIPSSQSS